MICMSYFQINALVEQATVITILIGILIIVRLILKRMFSIVFKVPLLSVSAFSYTVLVT